TDLGLGWLRLNSRPPFQYCWLFVVSADFSTLVDPLARFRLMGWAAAALSPRAWLKWHAPAPEPSRSRVRVAMPGSRFRRRYLSYCLSNRAGQAPKEARQTSEYAAQHSPLSALRRHLTLLPIPAPTPRAPRRCCRQARLPHGTRPPLRSRNPAPATRDPA